MTRIIGGSKPTGELPAVEGEGIFGFNKLGEGIFGGGSFQPARTPDGIFFNPYSRMAYEATESETAWNLERWPGVPLYPGSWGHGLNLVGPSMGGLGSSTRSHAGHRARMQALGANGTNQNVSSIPWGWAALGVAAGFIGAMLLRKRQAANPGRKSPTGYAVSIKGVGKVIVDPGKGTLRPTTHVVAQRLGVGYGADTTRQLERQRRDRAIMEASATGEVGMPKSGWEWLDHHGFWAKLS